MQGAVKIPWLKRVFLGVFLFSILINILYLTGSLFMLQIYDRVIPSRNLATLTGLIVLACGLYLFQALLDLIRARIFVRLARSFDAAVSPKVFEAVVTFPLLGPRVGDGLQPIRDVATIRAFLAGGGPAILFDLPWLPFFLAICFLFHVLIGLTAAIGAAVLLIFALASELMTRNPVKQGAYFNARQLGLAAAASRNAESLVAMGMTRGFRERWLAANEEQAEFQTRAPTSPAGSARCRRRSAISCNRRCSRLAPIS